MRVMRTSHLLLKQLQKETSCLLLAKRQPILVSNYQQWAFGTAVWPQIANLNLDSRILTNLISYHLTITSLALTKVTLISSNLHHLAISN